MTNEKYTIEMTKDEMVRYYANKIARKKMMKELISE